MEDILKEIMEHVSNEHGFKVGKSYPMKKEWIKEHEELDKFCRDLEKMAGKAKAMKKSLWSKIELELGEFGNMRINRENDEVEIEAEDTGKDKRKPTKSPFMRGL